MAKKVGYHNMVIDVATGIGTEATITVYDAGTLNQSTIYSDEDGTAKSNPFSTDSVGRFSFFADPATYDIQVSGSGITTYKLECIFIAPYNAVVSYPPSGEHRIKEIRLQSGEIVVVKYDGTPES
jgi:hypothetical protein